MKKLTTSLILAGFLAAAMPISMGAAAPDNQGGQDSVPVVNLFADENDWKHNKQGSTNSECVKFEGGALEITPRYVIGSTYCGRAMGQGRIGFTYQVDYPWLRGHTDEDLEEAIDDVLNADYFFGVLFSNSPSGVKPSGALSIPFNDGAGGFPYMVAFDSEKQNAGQDETRAKQLGLTLRRYKYDGSHDFTRWSSVEPTDATYVNTSGVRYESKIPAYHNPVTIAECFDFSEHRVDIDVKNLYAEKGDELDAVQIEVYFDGELSLRVIDEMPFESDSPVEEFTDKRTSDGYISVYAYGGTEDVNEVDNFVVRFKTFTAQFRESNGGVNGGTNGSNLGLILGISIPLGAAVIAGAAVTTVLLLNKKKKAAAESADGADEEEIAGDNK